MSEMAAKGKPPLATGPQKLVPDADKCGFAGKVVDRGVPGRAGRRIAKKGWKRDVSFVRRAIAALESECPGRELAMAERFSRVNTQTRSLNPK